MCPFDYTAFAVSGKAGITLTGLTTPVGLLVTPTDRPKSVRNRCVIEVFGIVCVCCPLVFEFSVGIGGFVIGLGQISFFFSCFSVLRFLFCFCGLFVSLVFSFLLTFFSL